MFEAYHGVTAAQHQANFNKFSVQGYRMISLSVYGDPGDARYAAVWVQRSGPAWVAVHGIDAAGYQTFFNNWTAKGFVPVLVSATGAFSDAIFAAVFEQGVAGPWLARHNMPSGPAANAGTFENLNQTAANQRLMIRSVAIYGAASDRRYAAVWHANPVYVKWKVHVNDPAANYQASFNAETQLPGYGLHGYRPAYVTLSSDQTYCSVFKDDVVGEWVARHGMTSAEYQAEFDKQNKAGFYPICVQGGGSDGGTRYAAIFAKQDIALSRGWTVTGAPVPALAGFDLIMQSFMQANGVRAAQLAIAKDGVSRFSRAYTWAEPAYRVTQPSDRFLLASCSKMFCAAAIQSLYNSGKLQPPTLTFKPNGNEKPVVGDTVTGNKTGATAVVTAVNGDTLTLVSVLNTFTTADTAATMSNSGGTVAVLAYNPGTKVYPLLGFSGPLDSRSDSITIQELLDHVGGYNDDPPANGGSGFDPTYHMREIALALGMTQPVKKLDVARYMYTKYKLDFDPGTQYRYSNYGYLLAGAVVEHVTKMNYFEYVNSALLVPAGITEVKVISTRASGRTNDEAIAEDQGLGLDPLDLASHLLIPAAYGGDGEINEVGDPNAGMAASAHALTQFIHLYAVWGNGPRASGAARSGSTPGASTWSQSRTDGVDWAYVINTRDWPPATSQNLNDLDNAVNNLLNTTTL